MTLIRTYSELNRLDTLEDRFDYLELGGTVGETTFGFDRWMNQQFYHSAEWRHIRNHVIARDQGMDLGAPDTPIRGAPAIHHMNPISLDDIVDATENLLDPEFLISAAFLTHNLIHYGDRGQLPRPFVERRPGDTKLW